MNLHEFLLEPYKLYSLWQIVLELIAAFFGISSVFFAIKKNVLVYPIGIISTSLYTYLLFEWGLYGDMLINGYYTIMSLYGWWTWLQKDIEKTYDGAKQNDSLTQMIACLITGFILVIGIYFFRYGSIQSIPFLNWIDALCTSLFLVAMYLMAMKRIENWHFWIIGDLLAIPLFITKGYGITAFQYLIFLIMAVYGLYSWRKMNL